jgi:hypothetical protein
MNCFEARKEFVSFWRCLMPPERRSLFVEHLRNCTQCDHSFRIFALTAPVLHSEAEPERDESRPSGHLEITSNSQGRQRSESRNSARLGAIGLSVGMAAAAAIAIYFAVAPHLSFEDAIADENPNVQLAFYREPESFLGAGTFQSALSDPVYDDSSNVQNDLAE